MNTAICFLDGQSFVGKSIEHIREMRHLCPQFELAGQFTSNSVTQSAGLRTSCISLPLVRKNSGSLCPCMPDSLLAYNAEFHLKDRMRTGEDRKTIRLGL